jgi:hypothetical protein
MTTEKVVPTLSFFDDADDANESKKRPNESTSEDTSQKQKRGRKTNASKEESEDEKKKSEDEKKKSSNNKDDVISVIDAASKPMFTVAQIHKFSQENDFYMLFHNSTPFKDLVDLIQPVLETITFKIVDRMLKNGQRFKGITVNSMDSKKVSMVVARLRADEVFPESIKEQEFSVKSQDFVSFLKMIKKGCCLEIKREKGKEELKIRGFNPNKRNHESRISVPTLDIDEKTDQLDTQNYKFIVDMDLQMLRNITRVAQTGSVNATNIKFQIYEGTDPGKTNQITKVCVSLDGGPGTANVMETFRSVTKWNKQQDGGQTVITTTDTLDDDKDSDDSDLVLVLDQKFSTHYLHTFLKSMDHQSITLRMSQDKPLVVIYQLDGGENIGYCNFILAPTLET